ncbi:MAG TPA: hypothetical protein ENI23_08135 [bacterium]|nr:hypothetical protein [bacterium]
MLNVDKLIEAVESYKKFVYLNQGQRQKLLDSLVSVRKELCSTQEMEHIYIKLQKFFQSLGTTEQQKLRIWVQKVVTYGLESVFEDKFYFTISEPEIKANEVSLDFAVVEVDRENNKTIECDPYDEMGGGVADVLSFLLQFLLVFLLRDRVQPIIFLDEAFKHLSTQYAINMAKLLSELCAKTGMQIVLVTHSNVYIDFADTLYYVSKDGFVTTVERVR